MKMLSLIYLAQSSDCRRTFCVSIICVLETSGPGYLIFTTTNETVCVLEEAEWENYYNFIINSLFMYSVLFVQIVLCCFF